MTQQRWRLDGQTALITGASAGIGLAIAHELAGFGADLMIVGRDIDMLETARDELLDVYPQMQVHALVADVSDDEDRRQILDWVEDHSDGLHILVNNAGGNVTKRPPSTRRRVAQDLRDQPVLGVRAVALRTSAAGTPRVVVHRQRRQRVRPDPCAQWRGLRHDQGGDAPDDPQPGRRVGRRWHPRQRSGTVVHPYPAHVRPVVGPGLLRRSHQSHADASYRRAGGSGCGRGLPACRQPATLPASASRWTAASCATGSDLRKGSAGRWPATTGYSVDCSCRPAAGTTGWRSPRHRAVAGLQHPATARGPCARCRGSRARRSAPGRGHRGSAAARHRSAALRSASH